MSDAFEPYCQAYRRHHVAAGIGNAAFLVLLAVLLAIGEDGGGDLTVAWVVSIGSAVLVALLAWSGAVRMIRQRLAAAEPLPDDAQVVPAPGRPTTTEYARLLLPVVPLWLVLVLSVLGDTAATVPMLVGTIVAAVLIAGACVLAVDRELARADGEVFDRLGRPPRFLAGLDAEPLYLRPADAGRVPQGASSS